MQVLIRIDANNIPQRFKGVGHLALYEVILEFYKNYLWNTADFIIKVPGVYTHSIENIYLSLVHTGSWGNVFFMKSPVEKMVFQFRRRFVASTFETFGD